MWEGKGKAWGPGASGMEAGLGGVPTWGVNNMDAPRSVGMQA